MLNFLLELKKSADIQGGKDFWGASLKKFHCIIVRIIAQIRTYSYIKQMHQAVRLWFRLGGLTTPYVITFRLKMGVWKFYVSINIQSTVFLFIYIK